MPDVPDAPEPRDLIALLYRADWTRLSLSAGVHEVSDWALRTKMHMRAHPWFPTLIRDLPPGGWTPDVSRARLRVAPGGGTASTSCRSRPRTKTPKTPIACSGAVTGPGRACRRRIRRPANVS